MRISINWVDELVNIRETPLDYLIEKLTLGGFEVEDVFEQTVFNKQTTILDISATANRADSLSIYGLGKEIAALLDKSVQKSPYHHSRFEQEKILEKILESKNNTRINNFSVFLTLTLKNITNINSPQWLQEKLISSGVTPVNNLLDYQNYIVLETGYPFEFYDFNKIKNSSSNSSFELKLENANSNQEVKINNQNCCLSNKILTLTSNNEILGISGIIPTDEYKYTESSSTILIEASIFNSKKIRQTSRSLGTRTERSARYEKDLMISGFTQAFLRLLMLLKTNNPDLCCEYHTICSREKVTLPAILLQFKNINSILGPIVDQNLDKKQTAVNYLNTKQISNYLSRLNFDFSYEEKSKSWLVHITESRINDISREIDLIEEIGRLHGFNNFTTLLPKVFQIGKEDLTYKLKKQLTTAFLNEGLTELIQYSLTNQNWQNTINIVNPLFTECSQLRQSLLLGLLKTISSNLKNSNEYLNGFEYGHIFKTNNLNEYKEMEFVGGILGSQTKTLNWSTKQKSIPELNWFIAKGKLETIFKKLNLEIFWESQNISIYQEILHPYRTAKLYLKNGTELGVFGQVNPLLANKLGIQENVYLFELNFELIKNSVKFNRLCLYKNYSTYPKIVKDLSFLIDETISFFKIKKIIYSSGTEFLNNVELLDVYEDESVGHNIRSLCVQLTFQSTNKTLVTTEIEHVMKNIQNNLIKNFNITIRM